KIWAVFQPHTFSRTEALLKDFGSAFEQADQVIILDICGSAREKSGQVHAQDLVREIRKKFGSVTPKWECHSQIPRVKYIPTIKKANEYLRKQAKAGQVVLTMGAGDVWKLSTILLF
ncbi:MAG: hypothetical protein ISS88_03155, partial [Candidatus Portnoybacteria bacterium]|nr:hypothetical protein [Candidatus Portnoybacteria bacterium]